MELNICYERKIQNPSAKVIQEELSALEPEQFAILTASEMNYIQTMNDPERGWVIEYQVNSTEEHFEATDPPQRLADVIAAFVSYAAGNDQWKSLFNWEQLELSDADFLVVSAVPADAIENGESPLEAEEFVELPEISLPLFTELCAILIGKSAATVGKKLKVVAEIEPEGMDPAQLIPLPEDFTLAFSSLKINAAKEVAERWRTAEEFPVDNLSVKQTTEIVKELSRVARYAVSDDWILVVSQF